jgi:antitoxin VapB
MALSLKNAELEKLARRRAKRRGETLTEAILSALKESERGAPGAQRKKMAEQLSRLVADVARLPVLSTRSEDEILGYDEHGVPRE